MKISVITINYNNLEGLRKTMESVFAQSCRSFEYIVVDGGSSDGGAELIRENASRIDKWVSERDGGIYNAMNKGVKMASGEYCLFLNSGDVFHDCQVMHKVLQTPFNADIVFGRVENVRDGKVVKHYVPEDKITLMHIYETGLHHAGSFIRTDLMEKYPYNEKLKICSDREFFIRTLVVDNATFQNLPFVVCDFEVGGASDNLDLLKIESYLILSSLFPPRVTEDYVATNLRLKDLTARMVNARGKIVKLVCGVDILMLKLFKLILGPKFYVKDPLKDLKNDE